MQIVLAILALGLMILAHELGHFLAAKRAGVTVHAFAIGFGPALFRFRRGETEYSINVLPLGGYVRLEGEDTVDSGGPGSFREKSVWARIAVVAAGPVMNLILAVLLFAGSVWAYGLPERVTNQIADLRQGWPAAQAGLQRGDRIVAIDGRKVADGEAMVRTIHQNAGNPLRLTVERGDQTFTVTVTPRLDPRFGVGVTGITPGVVRRSFDPLSALAWGAEQTVRTMRETVLGIARLITAGTFLQELAGPVGVVRFLGDAARIGFDSYLLMTAFLSVMIGMFNLLPIPALDGGRLAFLFVEAVRGRGIDPRREGYVHVVGFALLMVLILALTYRDILRWVGTNY